MCIAIYKPSEADFPTKSTLRTCFENNPDGAGFMLADGKRVQIEKGFMSFKPFWRALQAARKRYGDQRSFVLHFRITTQAGVRPDCTHPFPLSSDMDDLRALKSSAEIGIAHNGIIHLTSSYYQQTITYNDTMKFITEYLSLIIKDRQYHKNPDTLTLIERLAGSRLAIMDGGGKCILIGNGWRKDGGVWYSNDTYKPTLKTAVASYYKPYSYDIGATSKASTSTTAKKYNVYKGLYEFDNLDCPATKDGDTSYCQRCASYYDCWGYCDQ